MRTVFLGTPEFAVPALHAMRRAGLEVALVVSQPDRPRGRGRSVSPTPVRAAARELDLPNTTLEKGRRGELYERVLALRPDVAVVVAFGHIVRDPLLYGPRLGCLNVHASMLPRWRGPAPIHRAILNGDRSTGVCTMKLAAGVDTGELYECASTVIGPDETAGELHDRLAVLGAELLVSTLRGLEAGTLRARPQAEEGVTYAPMLRRDEGSTDFAAAASTIHDRIRGLDPWPSVSVGLGERRLKLGRSRVLHGGESSVAPGTILAIGPEGMSVACAPGAVLVRALQPPGGRWMSPAAYAQGHALDCGMVLEPLPDYTGARP